MKSVSLSLVLKQFAHAFFEHTIVLSFHILTSNLFEIYCAVWCDINPVLSLTNDY